LSNCPGRKSLSVRLFRLISPHRHDLFQLRLFAGKLYAILSGVTITGSWMFAFIGYIRRHGFILPVYSGLVLRASRGRAVDDVILRFTTDEFLHLAGVSDYNGDWHLSRERERGKRSAAYARSSHFPLFFFFYLGHRDLSDAIPRSSVRPVLVMAIHKNYCCFLTIKSDEFPLLF